MKEVYQKIIYGAPGTGKSYKLNEEAKEHFKTDKIERVTFYDGYSYANFVGTYKPVSDGENLSYKFVAGPFLRLLKEALKDKENYYLLIIEEINRSKADRVFGDIFQLLDRDKEGKSMYPISMSDEMKKYFESNEIKLDNDKLYLPSNFYIYATMNNADQGVYTLDSAFKRRWDFEYISINNENNEGNSLYLSLEEIILGNEEKEYPSSLRKVGYWIDKSITWNNFRIELNNILTKEGIEEDRLIGPYFFSKNNFIYKVEREYHLDEEIYKYKLLNYIYNDLLKYKPHIKEKIFNKDIKSFSDIIDKVDRGEIIFSENIINERLKKGDDKNVEIYISSDKEVSAAIFKNTINSILGNDKKKEYDICFAEDMCDDSKSKKIISNYLVYRDFIFNYLKERVVKKEEELKKIFNFKDNEEISWKVLEKKFKNEKEIYTKEFLEKLEELEKNEVGK